MKTVLFPVPPRHFLGQRWLRISVRTWHLASMGYLLGGTAYGLSLLEQPLAFWGTLLSGIVFVLLELYQSFVWLIQLKGQAVIVKLMLFWAASFSPGNEIGFLLGAVVIGGISSHMPGKFRYYSIFHGKIVKE